LELLLCTYTTIIPDILPSSFHQEVPSSFMDPSYYGLLLPLSYLGALVPSSSSLYHHVEVPSSFMDSSYAVFPSHASSCVLLLKSVHLTISLHFLGVLLLY
jgi:hypothetical protein